MLRRLASILAMWMLCASGGHALAQWSDDPSLNLAVADAVGEQAQPKILARPGGGFYVSWFDNRAGGYDVYLQLLDDAGVEQWPHDGVLVADRSFSSTQDYGLGVDTAGYALLAFRDDRFTGTQITAAKVDAAGSLVWGAGGVQLTSTTAFVAAPEIVGTSDGQVVVGWKQDADALLQRLDAAGAPVWPAPVAITDPLGRDYTLSDLQPADGGSVIASLVFQPSGFSGPKHLHAQKLSSLGAFEWGAAPLVVFDAGSLQFGNFPDFVTDGAGGGVFSWYGVSPLECYAQHVDATGTERFPHNGAAVSSSPRERSAPDAAYDPGTASTYVAWSELQSGPTPFYAIYAQRFDSTGVKQWGPDGVVLDPLTTSFVGSARVTLDAADAIVAWARESAPLTESILASKLDASGAPVWSQLAVSTAPSSKARLAAEVGPGFSVLAWSDDRADAGDVFVQNVNVDGTLGAPAAGPGEVAGLALGKGPGASELTIAWGASCAAGADYGVFEGTLASLRGGVPDHGPVVCTDATPALEETLAAPSGDAYFLVVPLAAGAEGSHGTRFDGERPVGPGRCIAAQALGCP